MTTNRLGSRCNRCTATRRLLFARRAQPHTHYERRRPETTVLHLLVREHIDTFLAQVKTETCSGLPHHLGKEFDDYLRCGVLAHGFLRLRCGSCSGEKLVGFSCKGRGFCRSCGARRIIAAIEQPNAIHKILTHLGLQAHSPPPAPARYDPEQEADLYDDLATLIHTTH